MSYLCFVALSGAYTYYLWQQKAFLSLNRRVQGFISGGLWLVFALTYYLCMEKFGFQMLGIVYFLIASAIVIMGILDCLKLSVPSDLLYVLSIVSGISLLLNPNAKWLPNVVAFVIIILVMVLVERFAFKGLGDGDLFVMAVIALGLGWQQAFGVLLIALVISGVVGAILLVLKVVHKKTVMPFVPFIAVVQIGLLFI